MKMDNERHTTLAQHIHLYCWSINMDKLHCGTHCVIAKTSRNGVCPFITKPCDWPPESTVKICEEH